MQNNTHTVAEGAYNTKKTHEISSGILEGAIASYESIATTFAANAIGDDKVRQQYIRHIKEISDQVRRDVAHGNLTVKEGAEYCSQLRDKLFVEYRKYTSAVGVAGAEKLKLEARGFDYYLNKCAQGQFGKDFVQLSEKERAAVYYTILQKAGGGNTGVTVKVRRLQILSKVGILVTALLAVYEVTGSKNKMREAARQGSIIAGGMIGGSLAGLAVSFVCGPAEPACAAALVLIGSGVGGMAGEVANDIYQDELEVFNHWINN